MEFNNLPKNAIIREVCPRDGFQSVKEFIPTEKKIEFINAMLATGVKEMEITSFVSPKAIPQLADAKDVLPAVKAANPGVEFTALVPNLKGAEGALAAGADVLNIVFSCSESHNMANIRRTVEQSLAGMDDIIALARGKAKICVSMATSFMCPFEGRMDPERVKMLIGKVREKGVDIITLAETIGTCTPKDFTETLRVVKPALEGIPAYLHIHNTYGFAAMNVKCALDEGFNKFDSAIGGLGGCPFAPGAAGNAATEDLVYLMQSMGVETGLDPLKLVAVARSLKDYGLKTMGSLCASAFGKPKPEIPQHK